MATQAKPKRQQDLNVPSPHNWRTTDQDEINRRRLRAGEETFTIVNYEQMRADALDVNARLRPDVVLLDEAQRIKN